MTHSENTYCRRRVAAGPEGGGRRAEGGGRRAEGYRWTIVNGEVTFEDGIPTGATPGKLLRHGRG